LLVICTYAHGCNVGDGLVDNRLCLPLPEFTKVPSGDTLLEILCPVKTRGDNIVSAGEVLEPGDGDRENGGAVNDDWVGSHAECEGNKSKQGGGREHLVSGVKRKEGLKKSKAKALRN